MVKIFKRLMLSLAAVVMASTAAVSFGTGTANASAYGCAFGNPMYGPSQYCVYISGSSTNVSYVDGAFSGSALICDYKITAEFFKTDWSWYKTYNSSTTGGCGTGATGGGKNIGINAKMQPGYMCSTLSYKLAGGSSTVRKMSVCHRIIK